MFMLLVVVVLLLLVLVILGTHLIFAFLRAPQNRHIGGVFAFS